MNRYYVIFEDIEKFLFLSPVQKEYILLVSKDEEKHFTIYDTESKTFLGVFANTEEEAICAFIEWYEDGLMVYDEEKEDYVPFENFSNHFTIYNEPFTCIHIIAGK